MVFIPITLDSAANQSATTGVHYGTHYHMLLVKFQTYLILKLLLKKATFVQQYLTIYSAMYQCFLSTVIYLFACYTSINYF